MPLHLIEIWQCLPAFSSSCSFLMMSKCFIKSELEYTAKKSESNSDVLPVALEVIAAPSSDRKLLFFVPTDWLTFR